MALEQLQKQALVERLTASKLQHHADALLAPTVWVDLEATDDEFELGTTRFGGLPDLPETTKWPRVEKNPLFFVGQFSLAELADFEAAKALPSKGLLSFFLLDVPRGEQLHCGEGVVLFTPPTEKLVRRELPPGWDDDEREPYALCRAHLTPGWMLPNPMEPLVASTLSAEERGRYSAPSMASGHYPTHLLGHRDHNGYSVQAAGMRLLLQLDSSDELRAEFGDFEDVDWFIDEAALANEDFSTIAMAGGA
ncbi:MAG: DUF1963 domain-containing protein [Myxococcaceae bacterium]